ncbi:ferric siderophore transport system, periplasmic binding protein TonB [Filimonas lacunae]|nr:ferric siderophore transport system, periplasmic binding protein TonB [Filimonas lacunae]
MGIVIWGNVCAQSDTIYTYYNPIWKPVAKDSATFYEKKYWQNQLLKKETYRADSGIVMRTGSFSDTAGKIEQGFFSRYDRYGVIRDSIYQEGRKRKEGWYFYNNGAKRAYFHTNAQGNYDIQKGWDENGGEIPNYIAFRPATFPGGDSVWKSYLVQHVSANQPIDYAAGKISGEVEILFTIAPDGKVTDVRLGKSSGYKELDTHALEIIKSSPQWIPCIQFNEHVRYFQRQSLTYSAQQQVIPQ